MPLWDTLTDTLVDHQVGGGKQPVDGVIVARTVPPQKGGTSKFLLGLYKGLSSKGVPAVGVEATDADHSAVGAYRRAGLSSVDDVDTLSASSESCSCSPAPLRPVRAQGDCRSSRSRRSRSSRARVAERLTVLVAARDEETVDRARRTRASEQRSRTPTCWSPTTVRATAPQPPRNVRELASSACRVSARARRLHSPSARPAPGPLLLCDADLEGDPSPLLDVDADLAIAAFAERQGGGFGLAKRAARALVRACSGFDAREPLSGQRALSPAAREACFPTAPGFGCEVRMTIDAVREGLTRQELELPLDHRPTARDAAGFLHRGRQLLEAALACGPLARNYRGLRLPLVGALVALGGARAPRRVRLSVAGIALIGLADDLVSGPERGFRQHLGSGRTTGVLKAVGIPVLALAATRSLSGAALVSLSANGLNLLDTRPGRALKAFLAGAALAPRTDPRLRPGCRHARSVRSSRDDDAR